ncbi:YgaP family membrane protein [Rheinheimera gaetbuli]
MRANVGGIDKVVRIIGGVVLVALAATGTVGVWGWIGIVPLLTGLFNFCPLYSLLGIKTCKLS